MHISYTLHIERCEPSLRETGPGAQKAKIFAPGPVSPKDSHRRMPTPQRLSPISYRQWHDARRAGPDSFSGEWPFQLSKLDECGPARRRTTAIPQITRATGRHPSRAYFVHLAHLAHLAHRVAASRLCARQARALRRLRYSHPDLSPAKTRIGECRHHNGYQLSAMSRCEASWPGLVQWRMAVSVEQAGRVRASSPTTRYGHKELKPLNQTSYPKLDHR
jgi:hypothetical protein